jgi:large subunit ribosomal protein L13Ae
MFEKEIVVDAKGHLVGRLASKIAKELLNGQKVTVVRCEQLIKSGSLFRNQLAFKEFLNKKRNTNPRKSSVFHYRAPSRIFWRAVRGMIPHKIARGAAAMGRLKVFDGIPYPYDHKKRMVVPEALKIVRLRDNRKFCKIGDLAAMFGWTKQGLVEKLENKRKEKSQKYWQLKSKKVEARKKAHGQKEVQDLNKELAQYGF